MSAPSVLTNVGSSSSWFDAFRDNGGPVLYSSMNRTPAIEDIRNILIYISFSTLFVAFLIIFPGIRKEVSHYYSFSILLQVMCSEGSFGALSAVLDCLFWSCRFTELILSAGGGI